MSTSLPHRFNRRDYLPAVSLWVIVFIKQSLAGASSFATAKKGDTINVPVDTFDHYCQTHQLDSQEIDMIKIDVEGFEYSTLQGMQETLARMLSGSYIFIEIHPRTETATETHDLLKKSSFALQTKTPQHNLLYQKT